MEALAISVRQVFVVLRCLCGSEHMEIAAAQLDQVAHCFLVTLPR